MTKKDLSYGAAGALAAFLAQILCRVMSGHYMSWFTLGIIVVTIALTTSILDTFGVFGTPLTPRTSTKKTPTIDTNTQKESNDEGGN